MSHPNVAYKRCKSSSLSNSLSVILRDKCAGELMMFGQLLITQMFPLQEHTCIR